MPSSPHCKLIIAVYLKLGYLKAMFFLHCIILWLGVESREKGKHDGILQLKVLFIHLICEVNIK